MEELSTWVPEPYDISRTPSLTSTLNTPWNQGHQGNFPRSAKWCSDGSSVISQYESGTFRCFDVSSFQESKMPPQDRLPVREFRQAAPILDFIWYPTATPRDPASFCFVASVRECPVKLLDASDGRLRASYKIVDHRERYIAPHSFTFNLTAQKLYCGFEDAIEVFDLSRPGEGTRISTTPSRKSKDGLKGIISALAFSSSYSPDESFYAAGGFTPTTHNIAMFSDAQPEPLMYLGGGPRAGVTQLRFNPIKPHILYASYRGDASGTIYSWDVRSNVESPLEIFHKFPDLKSTGYTTRSNQRKHFDIDVAGRLLSVGDQDGSISVFELDGQETLKDAIPPSSTLEPNCNDELDTKVTFPKLRFKAHNDAVGSVAFHPFKPIMLSASGSRHFLDEEAADDSDSSGEEHMDQVQGFHRVGPVALDSTMKIWDLRKQSAEINTT